MKRGTFDERQRARPPGNLGLRESVTGPDVSADVLARQLAERESTAQPTAELVGEGLELPTQVVLPRGILRGLHESAIRVLPLELRALHIGGHEAAA